MLKPEHLDKTKRVLEQFNEASDVGVNKDVFFLVDDRETTNKATNFFHNLQQLKKSLYDPD